MTYKEKYAEKMLYVLQHEKFVSVAGMAVELGIKRTTIYDILGIMYKKVVRFVFLSTKKVGRPIVYIALRENVPTNAKIVWE